MLSAGPSKNSNSFLEGQLAKMCLLRYAPKDKPAMIGVLEQWKRILERIGEMRFAATVRKCLETMSEFPSVPEFETRIPPADSEEMHPRCDMCRDTEGFIIELRPHPFHGDTMHRVARRCKHGL